LSATLSASVSLIKQGDDLREHLHMLIAYLKNNLLCTKWQLMPSDTAIQPLVVGGNLEALALSEYLQTSGVLVPAIRPPTVPVGTSRLRISLSAAHSLDDIKQLIAAINQAESVL
jgi:8-amino-7-oxononanoate synthase